MKMSDPRARDSRKVGQRNGLALGAIAASLVVSYGILAVPEASAGGYDTPMLYSARHIGMGGTAVAFVDDPSAIFHNPAGLANLPGRASLLADFSLLLGTVQGSPDPAAVNAGSQLTVAPFFLVGGAYKFAVGREVSVAVGAAVFPAAAASARYEYDLDAGPAGVLPSGDETRLFFLEMAPAVAVALPGRVRLGASYRVTYVRLERHKGPIDESAAPAALDLDMDGFSFLGFRVGAQWEAVADHLSVGVQYRHQAQTTIRADSGSLRLGGVAAEIFDLETDFVLPSRLSAGVRGDFDNVGVAFDVEYGFNSQNDSNLVSAQGAPGPGVPRVGFNNVSEWRDALTLRIGGELALPVAGSAITVFPRIGYVFDAKTVNETYPSAFGTPPGTTHVVTAGVGVEQGGWELNVAYAFRHGGASVGAIPDDARECAFCSGPGDYALTVHGLYADASYDFD